MSANSGPETTLVSCQMNRFIISRGFKGNPHLQADRSLFSVLHSTALYYTAHHSLTLPYALDTLTILHHTAFQLGSRFRSCACACFLCGVFVYIMSRFFISSCACSGLQGCMTNLRISFKIESLYIAPGILSKRQISFASRSLFVQRKIPVTSKAPLCKLNGDSFLVVPDRALNDWNATVCTNRFVVFGAADVLSAGVFYQRKKSKALCVKRAHSRKQQSLLSKYGSKAPLSCSNNSLPSTRTCCAREKYGSGWS